MELLSPAGLSYHSRPAARRLLWAKRQLFALELPPNWAFVINGPDFTRGDRRNCFPKMTAAAATATASRENERAGKFISC